MELPQRLQALSLFGDREDSVYAHYNHEVRKNMTAGERIAELERELETLRGAEPRDESDSTAPERPDWRFWRRKPDA